MMLSFKPKEVVEALRKACEPLRIGKWITTPYQLRHGGTSRGCLSGVRGPYEVQSRGHWKTLLEQSYLQQAGQATGGLEDGAAVSDKLSKSSTAGACAMADWRQAGKASGCVAISYHSAFGSVAILLDGATRSRDSIGMSAGEQQSREHRS